MSRVDFSEGPGFEDEALAVEAETLVPVAWWGCLCTFVDCRAVGQAVFGAARSELGWAWAVGGC
jgi:hypothetical protein